MEAKIRGTQIKLTFKHGLKKSYNQIIESHEDNIFLQFENYTK